MWFLPIFNVSYSGGTTALLLLKTKIEFLTRNTPNFTEYAELVFPHCSAKVSVFRVYRDAGEVIFVIKTTPDPPHNYYAT